MIYTYTAVFTPAENSDKFYVTSSNENTLFSTHKNTKNLEK